MLIPKLTLRVLSFTVLETSIIYASECTCLYSILKVHPSLPFATPPVPSPPCIQISECHLLVTSLIKDLNQNTFFICTIECLESSKRKFLIFLGYFRNNLFSFRVMQDRREQARQDLKGLEETVVR